MTEILKQKLFYLICGAFVLLNLAAILLDFPWLGLLPLVLAFTLLVLFKLDIVLLALAFLIPISININDIGFGLGISLPSEPLIMLIMVLALFKFLIDAEYDYRIFKHPITIVIFIHLFWTLVTTFTSELPITSFKFFLSKVWFVVVFYFLGVPLFRKLGNIHRFVWLHAIALLLIIFYTLKEHSVYAFDQHYSYTISMPFYVSHGVYASAICYLLPIFVCYLVFPQSFRLNSILWISIALVLIIFFVGLFYSYTRAAWLSIAVILITIIPITFRIRFNTMLVMLFSSMALVFIFKDQLFYVLSKNNQDSSADYFEHFRSASNIKTDASNMERLNRWICAIDMFADRPIVGFGPGTYSFVYGPYQLSRNRTVISTDYGDQGNAHSEYLQPLCESGLPGLLSILAIVYVTLAVGFRIYYTTQRSHVKFLTLGILLGMLSYYVHGVMNNYSETDKVACLFWGFMAMFTAIDLYHKEEKL